MSSVTTFLLTSGLAGFVLTNFTIFPVNGFSVPSFVTTPDIHPLGLSTGHWHTTVVVVVDVVVVVVVDDVVVVGTVVVVDVVVVVVVGASVVVVVDDVVVVGTVVVVVVPTPTCLAIPSMLFIQKNPQLTFISTQ